MNAMQKALIVAAAMLGIVCIIVTAVLRHQIGGFFENVAREEEQAQRERDEEDRLRAAQNRPDDASERKDQVCQTEHLDKNL